MWRGGVAVWRGGGVCGGLLLNPHSRVSMQSKANELATIAQLAIFWSCDVASSLGVARLGRVSGGVKFL